MGCSLRVTLAWPIGSRHWLRPARSTCRQSPLTMKEKYRDVQKHHHSGEVFQTSAELLVELRKDVLELKAEGIDILEGVESVALPAPQKGNGKGNGRARE